MLILRPGPPNLTDINLCTGKIQPENKQNIYHV